MLWELAGRWKGGHSLRQQNLAVASRPAVAGRTTLVIELKGRFAGDARLAARTAAVLAACVAPGLEEVRDLPSRGIEVAVLLVAALTLGRCRCRFRLTAAKQGTWVAASGKGVHGHE